MSWFDPYFIAISNLFVGGTQQVKERGVNLIAGTNVTITAVDNAAAARTDVTIASTGGGASSPTGTGVALVSGGAFVGAAGPVNLASSTYVTGLLPTANQAPQAIAGDSGGTTAAMTNINLTGATGTGQVSFPAAATGPGFNQPSTTATTGANFTISSQASTATNGNQGNVALNIPAKTGTGTEASFQFTRTGSAYPVAQIGLFPANAGVAGFWFPSIVGAPATATNAAVFGDGTDMYINSPSASGFVAITQGNNTQTATFYPAKAVFAAPILGDSTQSSPYGVHGDVTTAITTSTTLSAAQYAMLIIPVAPTAAMTLTLPRAAAGSGYSKLFDVQAAFAVTITDGTHSVTLPAAIGTYEVAFTNAKLMGGTTKL